MESPKRGSQMVAGKRVKLYTGKTGERGWGRERECSLSFSYSPSAFFFLNFSPTLYYISERLEQARDLYDNVFLVKKYV